MGPKVLRKVHILSAMEPEMVSLILLHSLEQKERDCPLPQLRLLRLVFGGVPQSPAGTSRYILEFLHKWGYPKMDGLLWKILLKWMICGYLYFRKPPNGQSKSKVYW